MPTIIPGTISKTPYPEPKVIPATQIEDLDSNSMEGNSTKVKRVRPTPSTWGWMFLLPNPMLEILPAKQQSQNGLERSNQQ